MKVAAILGEHQAGLVEVPDPTPKEDWVVVKIHASPMCTEYHAFEHGSKTDRMGHEAAGEVVDIAGVRADHDVAAHGGDPGRDVQPHGGEARGVDAVAADQDIVARTARENVIVEMAVQHIVARHAGYDVVAAAAAQNVGARRTGDAVACGIAGSVDVAGKFPPEKAKVPIYFMAKDDAPHRDEIVESFRNALKRAGYSVVSARENAAMIIELGESDVELSTISFGGRRVNGAEATLSMIATWAFDKSTFVQASGSGRAAERSQTAAISSAIAAATDNLFAEFNNKATDGKGKK